MEEEMSMKEKIDFLIAERMKEMEPEKKQIKIPRKAKVSKSKQKKGWIGILRIDENGTVSGEKQKIIDSTIRLKEGTYHTSSGEQIGFWEGKYPVIIQQTWKENPMKIRRLDSEGNETAGQKLIMARMLGDQIKIKSGDAKPLLWILGAAVVGYIAYAALTGQL